MTDKDRLTVTFSHELARYEIPNELVQQNGAYLRARTTTTAVRPSLRTRSLPTTYSFPEGSCRMATTLKPWGQFPINTFFPRRDGLAARDGPG